MTSSIAASSFCRMRGRCGMSSTAQRAHIPEAPVPRGKFRDCTRGVCCVALQASETMSLTEKMFLEIQKRNNEGQAGGAGGSTTIEGLRRTDAIWARVRSNEPQKVQEFVTETSLELEKEPEYDIAICGGTLGIFLATALQLKGLQVCVVERGKLAGRAQEWNISRGELDALIKLGVLTSEEVEEAIAVEFNPVRMQFKGGEEVWTKDVLNLGVRPSKLIELAANRFKQNGGEVLDCATASGATVHPNGVALNLSGSQDSSNGTDQPSVVSSKLLLDCMGHASPIVRQNRGGAKPDGVCCVVGSMASGFPEEANKSSDLIYSHSHITGTPQQADSNLQYFWEAFPAGSGPTHRTTYMFAYMDAEPSRPSLESMLEEYWHMMPEYQGVSLEDIQLERILYGFFPTYRDSPLQPQFDRILAVGDSSGIQSPLSFGGFGALTRHLERLTGAITEAVEVNVTDKATLGLINSYNPGLSSAWMLQKAMSVRVGENVDRDLINRMLAANFSSMAAAGDDVMKPFLQDVMRFKPFAQTVLGQMRRDPLFLPSMLAHVGPFALADWLKHFVALGLYGVGYRTVQPKLQGILNEAGGDAVRKFRVKRFAEALEFGSGYDHK